MVHDPEEAMKPGSPLVEPEWGDNIMVSARFATGDPDKAFAEADGTISGVIRTQRYHRRADRAAGLCRHLRSVPGSPHVLGLDAEPAPAPGLPRGDAAEFPRRRSG